MAKETNKPGGSFDKEGKPRPVADQQAVKNQSPVTPDDYPDDDGGKPDYRGTKK